MSLRRLDLARRGEPRISRGIAAVLLFSLAGTAIVAAAATWYGVLYVTVIGAFVAAALVVAVQRPTLLLYLYCVAIPFNFALPPGPIGTVARIAGIAFFVGYLIRRPDALRPRVVPLAGWAFVAWALATSLWAISPDTAFEGWRSIVQLFVITVLVASIVATDRAVTRPAMLTYAISATVTAAVAMVSYLQSPVIYLTRATAFADQDPALFASIVLPAVVILMAEAQDGSSTRFMRLGALVALIVCVLGLALSGTRSGWIGVVVAVVTLLVLQRERRQLLSLAAVGAAIAVLVTVVPGMGEFLFGRAEISLSTGGSGRTDIWAVGLYVFTSSPILGVGFANFPDAFTPYAIEQASGGLSPIYTLSAGRAPHNVVLGSFAETGVIGGLLLVWFAASGLRLTVTGRLRHVVTAVLVGLYAQALFLDILQQKQLWLFLAIAFGLIAANRQDAQGSRRVLSFGRRSVPAAPASQA